MRQYNPNIIRIWDDDAEKCHDVIELSTVFDTTIKEVKINHGILILQSHVFDDIIARPSFSIKPSKESTSNTWQRFKSLSDFVQENSYVVVKDLP